MKVYKYLLPVLHRGMYQNIHLVDSNGTKTDICVGAFLTLLYEICSVCRAFWSTKFYYCLLYVPHAKLCEPKGDGISSMDDLLNQMIVRICIWVVATITCLGNITVMVGRTAINQDNRPHSIIIKNLCCESILGIHVQYPCTLIVHLILIP